MIWMTIFLLVVAAILFLLYRKSMSETMAVRSMFVMAVFDDEFSQGQRKKIIEYMRSIEAKNAEEVATKFNSAFDEMSVRLVKSPQGSILLGAHAALWAAFKEAKPGATS